MQYLKVTLYIPAPPTVSIPMDITRELMKSNWIEVIKKQIDEGKFFVSLRNEIPFFNDDV